MDYVVHMDSAVHNEVDNDFDTIFVGKVRAGSVLVLVQTEPARRYSLNMCLLSSPSGAHMLYNPSHHPLLTYKIYTKGWLGYLQYSTSINNPHHDSL